MAVVLALLVGAWRWSSLRILIAGGLAGSLLTLAVANFQQGRQLHPSLVGQDITLTGRIADVPLHDARRTVFRFEVDTFSDDLHVALGPRRLRLSWYGRTPSVRAGERWQFTVRLKTPRMLGNPGGFDYAAWLFQQRIQAVGYVRPKPPAVRLAEAPDWDLHAVRQRLAEALAALPAANEHLPVLQAITLGVSHAVSETSRQLLRDSGTAHLLAISGLHIGLIASWAYALGVLVWRGWPSMQQRLSRQGVALVISVLAAGCYAALAGFALPTQRALLMLLVVALAMCGAVRGISVRSTSRVISWLLALIRHGSRLVLLAQWSHASATTSGACRVDAYQAGSCVIARHRLVFSKWCANRTARESACSAPGWCGDCAVGLADLAVEHCLANCR